MFILNKKFLKVYIIVFLFLISPSPSHALTTSVPLNASSSALYLENYTSLVTATATTIPFAAPPCETGGASTHNSALFFDTHCRRYELSQFQNNISFHVLSPYDATQGGREILTIWSNSDVSIYAGAAIVDHSASAEGSIQPFIGWNGIPQQGTEAIQSYPFDLTFSYIGDKVTVYINDQVIESLYTGNVVNARTLFMGDNIVVGSLTSDTNGAIQDQYVSCSIFDIPCNLHNFQTWLVKLVMPTTASLDEIATIKTSLDNKIPFAYFSTATGLDFSASGVATQTPGFTLPMMSAIASTSGQPFHPITTGLTSYTFNGSTMTLIGQFSKPFFQISMWVGFIMLIVKITIKMLT